VRKTRLIGILAAVSTMTLLLGIPAVSADQAATYRVTITNLTDGQPMTPALVAAHKGNDVLFTVGEVASLGLKEIAENGNLDPLFNETSGDDSFDAVVIETGATGVPPIMPGETITFELESGSPFNFLSWASMLICTNDGFTGVDTLKLPNQPGQVISVTTQGYDAGTEDNTELFADIVPPCGPLTGQDSAGQGTGSSDPALAENGVIHHHEGILGIGDLDAGVNDWLNPVAMITVERTS